MAVAFDAVGPTSAGTGTANTTSLSWSHTCSGTNRLLTVAVALGGGTNLVTLGVTYNSVSLTSAGTAFSDNGVDGLVQMFYLVAPATGSHTVQVTCSAARDLESGSVSFTGVDQATPISNVTTAFGSNPTQPSVTVASAVGNMVVDGLAAGNSIASSNHTNRWIKNLNANSTAGNAAQSTAAGAASVNMAYTITLDAWGIVGMNINAAVVVTPVSVAWLTA